MGLKKEKAGKVVRGIKTVFFLITMLASLLLFAAPVFLVVLTDALLPSALLSAFLSPLSIQTLTSHIRNYDFRASVVDIPLISIARSVIIICVYCMCDGRRLSNGPYLAITTLCSFISLGVVSLKACVFGGEIQMGAMKAMFISSFVLAVGHVVVAYRTSSKEKRKLLVYKIDIEAISSCKNGFPSNHKVLQVRLNR